MQARLDAQEPHRWAPPAFDGRGVDVVVVGAGIGGLVAGALLARSGKRVLVAEQHTVPGGFAHNWTWAGRDGDAAPVFRFDSGVHDVSGTWPDGPVHGILARLGLENAIEWKRLDHRFLLQGAPFDVPRGWEAYVDALATRVPQDAAAIRATMADLRAIFEGMYSEGSKHSGIPGSPRTVDEMLAFASNHPLVVRWMDKPFGRFLAAHGLGDEARRILTALCYYVTDDADAVTVGAVAPLFGYFLHGGFYPAGGSGRLAQAFVDSIALDDGEVRLGAPVKRVLAENGRATGVELASGEVVRTKAVVLNADFLQATTQLVDPALWPAEFRASLARREPACSACYVTLGVKGDLPDVPPITHVLDERGGVGVVVPTAVDPSAAPAGYSTVELIRLVPHAEAKAWFRDPAATDDAETRSADAYLARKAMIGEDMIRMAERALPGLSSRIVCRTEASPLTFRRYDWSSFGAIYGTKGDAVATKSPIPGIVFAGAATHGAGIEAVAISGALAAEALVPGLLDTARGA
jgi:phytoene dehydrogenase-like protein